MMVQIEAELAVGLSISYKLDEDLWLSSRTTLVFNLQKLGNYLAPELTSSLVRRGVVRHRPRR